MWEMTLAASFIGAHIQKHKMGFRARDVRFLMELFWNWQTSTTGYKSTERIHNTQLKRYLDKLIADSWATKLGKETPKYRLSRSGLIGLLMQVKNIGAAGSFEEFLFARYFLCSYQDRITSLVEKTGAPMPIGYRTEIKHLLDISELQRERIERLKHQERYLSARISETEKTISFAKESLRRRQDLPTVVSKIEQLFPYELNYQKPMSQLFAETPEDLQAWELVEGNEMRIQLLWQNYLVIIRNQINLLETSLIKLA